MAKGFTTAAGGAAPTGALARRAVAGVAWLSAGNAARAVVKLAVLAVLARLLDPDAFGVVGAATLVVWLSAILATLGVGPSLVQMRTIGPAHVATAFVASAALGLALGAAVFAAAGPIAGLFRMPALAPILQVMAVAFPVAGLATVAECMLQRELRFDVIARAELVSYAGGYGVAGIGLAALGAGAWALVGAELAKACLKTALFLRAVPPPRPLRFGAAEFGQLARFGWRYTLGHLAIFAGTQGDVFVVGRLLGASALGLWGRAVEIMLLPAQAIGVVVDKVLFATLSRVQQDRARLATSYRRASALVAMLVLPTAAVTLVLAPEIVSTLLGAHWHEVVAPLRVLALAMHLRVGYMVGLAVANAAGAAGETAWRNLSHGMLVLAGAWLGAAAGLPGVAAGVTAAIAVNYALVLRLGLRITGLPLRAFLGAHAAAVAMSAAAAGQAWAVAAALRAAGAPGPVVLASALATVAASALCLLRFAPRLLGPEAAWLLDTLQGVLPARLRRWLPSPTSASRPPSAAP